MTGISGLPHGYHTPVEAHVERAMGTGAHFTSNSHTVHEAFIPASENGTESNREHFTSSSAMTPFRLISILGITGAATVAWFLLGGTLLERSQSSRARLGNEVKQIWGPGLSQPHPEFLGDSADGTEPFLPSSSQVHVQLEYTPKKRGLIWHRTYDVTFSARYEITNTAASARNVRIRMGLPAENSSYDNFVFQVGDKVGPDILPKDGAVETVTLIPAGATIPVTLRYQARGLDRWTYTFPERNRVKNFNLILETNFDDISFPVGASSASKQQPLSAGDGMELTWNHADTIDAQGIAMDMPRLLNAGPVIARITFFAPLSLMLFFGVLVVVGMMRGIHLHPMVFAFMAAGFFTFHLLLAYLGDQMPLHAAFAIAAVVSLALVSGYLHLVAGRELSTVAVAAQVAYLVLFSYSFFFDGLTGITLTVMAVSTLGLLMYTTAKLNWEDVFKQGAAALAKARGDRKDSHPLTRAVIGS